MGSRSDRTLKTLEARAEVLERLRGTLSELQDRAPALPSIPGGLPKIAKGGGSAGMAMWILRRAMKRRKKVKAKEKELAQKTKKAKRKQEPQPAVTVKVMPTGTAVAIVAAAAIWAGVKVFEMQKRGARGEGGVVRLRKGA